MKYLSSSAATASSSRDRPRTERRSPSFGKRGTEKRVFFLFFFFSGRPAPSPSSVRPRPSSAFVCICLYLYRCCRCCLLSCHSPPPPPISLLPSLILFLPSFPPLDDVASSSSCFACRLQEVSARLVSGSARRNRLFPLIDKNVSLPRFQV